MKTIALAFPHCPWDPHRIKSLARIKAQLGIRNDRDDLPPGVISCKTFAEQGPVPNWVWSGKMFEWMSAQESDYVMQIQDDVLLCPEFLQVVQAMLQGAPAADIINCFTITPLAPHLAQQRTNWATTTDWMVGPTWIMKTEHMRETYMFREAHMRTGWHLRTRENGLNEDTLIGLIAASLGVRIWTPVPAVVNHDTSMPSNYGNAHGAYNKASLDWKQWELMGCGKAEDLLDPIFWAPRNTIEGSTDSVFHQGLAYSFTPYNFLRWVSDDGSNTYGGLTWDERADKIRSDVVQMEAKI